jgi:uncharacterized protein YceK
VFSTVSIALSGCALVVTHTVPGMRVLVVEERASEPPARR